MKKEKASKSLIPKKAEIGTSYDYLKNTDPNAYFYRKFKDENNEIIRDTKWNTATQNGQLDSLIYLLNSGNIDREYFDKYKQYENLADYDTYMTTLKLNYYDDTEKKMRENNVEMTDREYMKAVLDNQYRQFDYKILEDKKANMNIFSKIASSTGYALGSFAKDIAQGVLDLAQLVQGTGNFLYAGMKDVSDLIVTGGKNQVNMGTEFLRAFDDVGDRDVLDKLLTAAQDELLKFEDDLYRTALYNTDLVNAEDAQYLDDLERGQLTMIEYLARKNSGAGMTFGGEFVKGVSESIGYLIPGLSAGKVASKVGGVIAKNAGKIARTTFFGQIEGGNIRENTQMYLLNGSSLNQINAGEVITNATIKTSLEYGIEKLMSFTLGSTLLDRMLGMGTNRTLISGTKKLADTSKKAQKSVEQVNRGIYKGEKAGIVSSGFARLSIDAAKEGLEEVIQDFSNNLVDLISGGYYAERGLDNNSLENYFQSFIIGAFTSGIISSVKTATTVERVTTADGSVKNVLGFKAMSIQEAIQQMYDWKNEITNNNISVEERLENAKAFTKASMMLAPIYSAFSEEDLTKALNILDGYKNARLSQTITSSTLPISRRVKMPTISVDNRTIDVSGYYNIHTERISGDINVVRFDSENAGKYCNDILNKINKKRAEIRLKPITKDVKNEVQKVMKDNADKLENAGANEINNIVTDDGCYIDIEGKPVISKELSRIIKELGIKAVVGTNGNVLITDKDIMVVDNKILETEDIATIIQTEAYSRAVKSAIYVYRTKYNKLYNHILNTYAKSYGIEENAETVFNTLLFDKSFFIKVLLSCNTNDILSRQIVALFDFMNLTDKTITAVTRNITNFNTKTYKAAMIKAKEVLRDSIILYGTQYQNITPIIENVPKSVINDDIKKELMNNHNVQFSNDIDRVVKEKEPSKLLKMQNDIINECDIIIRDYQKKFDSLSQNDKTYTNDMINLLSDVKTLIGSDNLLDRQQGKILFISYLHSVHSTSSTTYLPIDVKDAVITDVRKSFKKYTGISVKDFVNGKWTMNTIKDSAKLYLIGSGITNTSPENVLISAAKEIVYEISDRQFTINENGALLKIINLLDICDRKTLEKKFKELKTGKSFKIKDVITLSDNKILNILGDIEVIPKKSNDIHNAVYLNENNVIEMNTTKVKSFNVFIDVFAHEFTHAVDYNLFLNLSNKYWARGGSIEDIKNVFSKSEKKRFDKWLNEKMPYLTKYANILLRKENISSDAYLFYIMTQGELNAYGFNNLYDVSGTLVERKSAEKSNEFQLRMLDGTTFDITPIYNKYLSQNDKKIPEKTESKKPKKTESKQESISLFDIEETSSKPISKLEEKVTDRNGYTYINKRIASTGKFSAFYGKRITNNIYYVIEQASLLDDYDNLSGHFKKLIETGELTDTKLQYYLSNVKSLNDYTFKFLALNYYKNAELAKLTFLQFKDILMNIRNITYNAALKSSAEINTIMSIDDILKLKVIPNLSKLDEKYTPFRLQFADFTADYYYNTKSTDYIPVIGERNSGIDDLDEETRNMIKRMTTGNRWLHANLITSNPLLVQGVLMKLYDGTLQSIMKTNRTCLQISYMQTYRPDPKIIDAETGNTEQSTWNWIDNVNYADKTFADDVNIYDDTQGEIDNEIELTTDQKIESIRLYIYRQEYEKWINATIKKLEESGKDITLEKFLSKNMTDKYGNSIGITKLEYIKNKAYEKADDTISKINKITDEYNRQQLIDNFYKKSSVVIDNKLVIESTRPNLDTINKDIKVYKKRENQKTARKKLHSSIRSLKTTLQKNVDDYILLPDELKKLFKIENGKVIEKKITKTDTKANSEVITSNINDTNVDKKEFKQKTKTTTQYRNYTEEQINDLTSIILQSVQNIRQYRKDIAKIAYETEKNNKKIMKKMLTNSLKDGKPIVQKIDVEYVKTDDRFEYNINKDFQIIADRKPTKMVTDLLSTTFSKSAERDIKATGDKLIVDTWNGKEFFKQNANTFANADVNMLEETARWFLSSKLKNMSVASGEYKLFTAVNFYFLMWIQLQCRDGAKFDNFNRELFKECTAMYNNLISSSGAQMGAHRSLIHQIDPEKVVEEQSIVLDGVELSEEEQEDLLNATKTMNIERINKIQDIVSQRIVQESNHRKTFLSKITAVRQSFMLSSPLTWIRNVVSNYVLKSLNKLSDKIGNLLLNKYKRHQDVFVDQYRLNVKPTEETLNFINKNFIDNRMYDTLISHLSRFNSNEFSKLDRDFLGKPTLEAIFTKIVIDSLYAKYYSENTFKNNNIAGKAFNNIHKFIMKMLSDNNIIKKVSLDYFAKILQENNRDLSQGLNEYIMRDFVTALQLGLNDYMHTDNIFTDIRDAFVDKGEISQFVFDNTLPFVSTTWNWFKTMLRFTPIGIVKGTWTLMHLDKAYDKADTLYNQSIQKFSNKSLDPKLTAYLAARDLGSGIIGTALIGIGMLMAALGWLDIDDDDYDVPKVKFTIGDVIVKLDVSSIFGSSSLLAGAALVIDAHKNGISYDNIMKGIGANLDFLNTQNPVMTLLELDMGQGSALDKFSNYAEKYFLSFIPNFLSFVSGSIFQTGGEPIKTTIFQKAVAKLPFGDLLLDKKRNPYTGEYTTDYWNNLINKGVPYVSYKIASKNEQKSIKYGLNKTQLKGKYNINDKSFTADNVDELNKLYGQMNAEQLTDFYSNKTFFKIKSGTKYKTLSYNQMTDDERKTIVQRIMSNNANIVKIKAWTDKGNIYYADNTLYKDLMKAGVTKNVFKGNKGYVEK